MEGSGRGSPSRSTPPAAGNCAPQPCTLRTSLVCRCWLRAQHSPPRAGSSGPSPRAPTPHLGRPATASFFRQASRPVPAQAFLLSGAPVADSAPDELFLFSMPQPGAATAPVAGTAPLHPGSSCSAEELWQGGERMAFPRPKSAVVADRSPI
ncbi:hypothetical protein NDU88_004666 [Pleurodeles waltl]|uniref:Uncharacterized protein n=1 Tax=Pleurodeles waltl TaxID=8319 RepID=A0AAV7NNB5_PLEWA|nr:hypothetical protein NDU88_004666 [Pleurodeles waltl]